MFTALQDLTFLRQELCMPTINNQALGIIIGRLNR